jgi:hypothetical protein
MEQRKESKLENEIQNSNELPEVRGMKFKPGLILPTYNSNYIKELKKNATIEETPRPYHGRCKGLSLDYEDNPVLK